MMTFDLIYLKLLVNVQQALPFNKFLIKQINNHKITRSDCIIVKEFICENINKSNSA